MAEKLKMVTVTDGKLSYVSTTCNIPLVGYNISEQLDISTAKWPDKVVYIFHKNNELHLTFSDVKERAHRLAQNFLQMGLKKGDRIAITLPFTHELLIIYIACAIVGIIAVPLDPQFGLLELEYMLYNVQPTAFVAYNIEQFAEKRQFTTDLLNTISTNEEPLDSLKFLIVLDDGKSEIKYSVKGAQTYDYNELADKKTSHEDLPIPYVDRDDPFVIVFSSGTTAKPKGSLINHSAVINMSRLAQQLYDNNSVGQRLLTDFAMYHVGAICNIIGSLSSGRTIVYPSLEHEFKEIFESCEKYKCDAIQAPPRVLDKLLLDPERHNYNLKSLRHAFTGSMAVPIELIERVKEELGIEVVLNGYGMSEMTVTHCTTLEDGDMRGMMSIGRPLPYIECKIVDPITRQIVPILEEGELMVRGYSVLKQYWNNPEMTKAAFDENGWFKTSDMMKMDADGYFYFKNRIKDVLYALESGRFEIYPSQVEEELRKHSNVYEAVVFGVPINAYASHICAWIKLKDGAEPTTGDELQAFLAEHRLADYKIPKFIKFVDDFPVNNLNKYLRTEMTRLYKAELNL